MSERLTDGEAWDVLETSHTGILTSLRRDGVPVSLPVWFVVDDRAVLVAGPAASHKFTHLRRDARVAFLVESGEAWKELRPSISLAGPTSSTGPTGRRLTPVRGQIRRLQDATGEDARIGAGPLRRPGRDRWCGSPRLSGSSPGTTSDWTNADGGGRPVGDPCRRCADGGVRPSGGSQCADRRHAAAAGGVVRRGRPGRRHRCCRPHRDRSGVLRRSRHEGDRRSRPRAAADRPGRAIRSVRKPVIGAVNGPCVTGGLEIARSCDFLVASELARFADTHAHLGVLPRWGMSALLPRAVGIRWAKEARPPAPSSGPPTRCGSGW